jgi:hypothetical protein
MNVAAMKKYAYIIVHIFQIKQVMDKKGKEQEQERQKKRQNKSSIY